LRAPQALKRQTTKNDGLPHKAMSSMRLWFGALRAPEARDKSDEDYTAERLAGSKGVSGGSVPAGRLDFDGY